jgi:hypothetical protein
MLFQPKVPSIYNGTRKGFGILSLPVSFMCLIKMKICNTEYLGVTVWVMSCTNRPPSLRWELISVCSAFIPFSKHLTACWKLYFWSGKLCLLNDLKFFLGRPLPLVASEWVTKYICLWGFGVVPVSRKPLEFLGLFQLSHYRLPLRNALQFNTYV